MASPEVSGLAAEAAEGIPSGHIFHVRLLHLHHVLPSLHLETPANGLTQVEEDLSPIAALVRYGRSTMPFQRLAYAQVSRLFCLHKCLMCSLLKTR